MKRLVQSQQSPRRFSFCKQVTQEKGFITMLPVIQSLHNLSVLYPSTYWLIMLSLFVAICKGWFVMGTLQPALVSSPAPQKAAARPRVTLYRKGLALVLQFTGLLILASFELRNDSFALTLAAKVT
jgi:hypothetical protein